MVYSFAGASFTLCAGRFIVVCMPEAIRLPVFHSEICVSGE